jgi:hypothetical protein
MTIYTNTHTYVYYQGQQPKICGAHQDMFVARQGTGHMHQDMVHVHQDAAHVGGCCRRVRCVVRGKRVTEEQARAHAAAGTVVHQVPELLGGGCGMSVSVSVVYVCVCACICMQAVQGCAMGVCSYPHAVPEYFLSAKYISMYMCACMCMCTLYLACT